MEQFQYPVLSCFLPYDFGHEMIQLSCPESLLLSYVMELYSENPELKGNLFSNHIPGGKWPLLACRGLNPPPITVAYRLTTDLTGSQEMRHVQPLLRAGKELALCSCSQGSDTKRRIICKDQQRKKQEWKPKNRAVEIRTTRGTLNGLKLGAAWRLISWLIVIATRH